MARGCTTPINGWDLDDVLSVNAGPATNDKYGKLTCYLRSMLRTSLRKSAELPAFEMEICCVDVKDLHAYVEGQTFDHIEVSSSHDYLYSEDVDHDRPPTSSTTSTSVSPGQSMHCAPC